MAIRKTVKKAQSKKKLQKITKKKLIRKKKVSRRSKAKASKSGETKPPETPATSPVETPDDALLPTSTPVDTAQNNCIEENQVLESNVSDQPSQEPLNEGEQNGDQTETQ